MKLGRAFRGYHIAYHCGSGPRRACRDGCGKTPPRKFVGGAFAEKAIEKVRSNMHAKVERTAAELETRTAAVEENLRKTYAENKAQWVETITDAVTEA